KSLFSLGSRFRARIFFYIAIQAARRGEPLLDRQPSSNPSAEVLKRGRAQGRTCGSERLSLSCPPEVSPKVPQELSSRVVPQTISQRSLGVNTHVASWATRTWCGRHAGGRPLLGGLDAISVGGRRAKGNPDRLGHLQSRLHAAQKQGPARKGLRQG